MKKTTICLVAAMICLFSTVCCFVQKRYDCCVVSLILSLIFFGGLYNCYWDRDATIEEYKKICDDYLLLKAIDREIQELRSTLDSKVFVTENEKAKLVECIEIRLNEKEEITDDIEIRLKTLKECDFYQFLTKKERKKIAHMQYEKICNAYLLLETIDKKIRDLMNTSDSEVDQLLEEEKTIKQDLKNRLRFLKNFGFLDLLTKR